MAGRDEKSHSEHARYHGPNPTRALAPLAGLLLFVGFTVRATGYDPLSVADAAFHWIGCSAQVTNLPDGTRP